MRIPSGITDQYIYFVAVDSIDFTTRETGLSSFTVYRSRNGAAAAAMTTPTINETDATNMPGVYELLVDEDTTLDAGDDTQEMAFHITHAGMAPVTRAIEIYRPDTTLGNTLDVTSTGAGGIDWSNVENPASNVNLSVTTVATAGQVSGNVVGNVGSITGVTFPTNFGSMSITTTTGLVDIVSTVPSAATIADAVWDEALADHVTDATFGLAAQVLDTGTATNGDVNNITLDAGMVFTADAQCQDCYIDLISGVGAGQSRPITAFTFSTRIATVVPNWTTAPQNGTKYRIRDYRQVQVKSIANSVITAASIATDAIGADELATDAVTEIRDAITATYPTNFGDMAITTTTGLVDVNDKTGFRLSATGVDDILDEAIPEPTGTFTWSGDLRTIVGWLGALSRNKQTQSSTQTALRNDADAGDISTSVTTDNGTTFTRGEWT